MDQKAEMERAVAQRQQSKELAKKQDERAAPPTEKLTPDDLRKQLAEREVRMNRRVDAIKSEVLTTGDDVQRAVFGHPLVSVGGSLLAGLAIGLLVGKRKRAPEGLEKALQYLPGEQRKLAEAYAKAVEQAARRAVKRGEDAGDAVRAFLGSHAPPVIVSEGGKTMADGNVFKQSLDTALKTALGFLVKAAIDQVMIGTGLAKNSPAIAKTVEGSGTSVVAGAVASS